MTKKFDERAAFRATYEKSPWNPANHPTEALQGHTPGPLTVSENEHGIGWLIHRGGTEVSITFDKADAVLQAAAPDMLEALRYAVEFNANVWANPEQQAIIRKRLLSAIARATNGGSQ